MNYNNQHTFDNYIVSECNKEAYTACRSIVDDADGRFVALYGPSPCGKTHLLNAVKYAFQNKYPTCAILATTFEDLISQYLRTIDEKRTFEFRRFICSYDLIIIDNMQFAAGKSATQEEISYWFCEMLDSRKSVLIAWDRSERCLDDLLTRMRDRYSDRCHILEMNEPDAILRKEYFERLINSAQISVPSEVCKCVTNSRRIPLCAFNGFLIKLKMLQDQKGKQLTRQEMVECLNDYTREEDSYD